MARFFVPAILSFCLVSTGIFAQTPGNPDASAPKSGNTRKAPAAANPAPTTLESLFERLAQAKDQPEARVIASQIERRWQRSGSDTTDLLMGRVTQMMNARDNAGAIDLLDYIILLRPDWAEPYNRRATIMFLMDDYDASLRDIRATLAREPRHYGALAGLGMIMQRMENPKAAFAAFERALRIHPYLESIKDATERLKLDVEDKKI